MTLASEYNDVITIIRDPKNALGKRFAADGTKTANVQISMAFAVQKSVPTAGKMAAAIMEVSGHTNYAIINASFPTIPVGEEFLILSEKQFAKQLGIAERTKMGGVHSLKLGGKVYKAIGRFKENCRASTWQILDRDVDNHTPREFASLNYDGWLSKVDQLLPGLLSATRIQTLSSSARVTKNGKVLGGGNGHTWIQVQDAADTERVRTALQLKAMELGLSWRKPRYSKADPSKVVGHGFATLIDQSVWTPGRLVFNGMPSVGAGLTVKAQKATIFKGTRLDTSRLAMPDAADVPEISRKAGLEIRLNARGDGPTTVSAQDLTYATEIELPDGTLTTVRDAVATLPSGGKLRCQTPFRASQSEAAFLSRGASGKPFIHDVGTGTTHWLSDGESIRDGHLPLNEGDLPLKDLLEHLSALTVEDLQRHWAGLALNRSAQDKERLMEFVGMRPVNPS